MCPHTSTGFPRPAVEIEVKLEPTAQAAGAARRFVARQLESLGYPRLVEDVRLIVSELVTNSITAVPDKPLWVDIRRSGRHLILQVWDCSPTPPVAGDAGLLAEGGRGLHVVDELSDEWGCDPFCCGKVIWVLLAIA